MSFFRTFTSVLPSTSPPPPPIDEEALQAMIQNAASRLPRKPKATKLNDREQPPSDIDHNDSESMDLSGILVQSRSSTLAAQGMDQELNRVQGFEQSDLPDDHEPGQPFCGTPDTIQARLESNVDVETVGSEIDETTQTANSITTTTTTTVEQRKRTDVQRADQSVVESVSTQTQYGAWSSTQGGAQRKASFYQETALAPITEAGQLPMSSSVSTIVETRRAMTQSGTMYNSVQEELKRLKSLYIQQTDCTESILTNQHKEYERSCEEGFTALQTENVALRQRISMLEFQLRSGRGHATTPLLSDNTESTITTITTNITTITTSITTVTAQINQWKRTVSSRTGQIMLSSKDLEQLSSDLSLTSTQLSELQERYTQQSGDIIAVRNELQATLTLRDENSLAMASLTAELAQLKQADAMKAEQIAASSARTTELQQDYESQLRELMLSIEEKDRRIASTIAEVAQLQRADALKAEQITASSTRLNELQQRYDTQLNDLASVRNELQGKVSLIEENNRTIASITAEVTQWKHSDSTKAEQFATLRGNNEELQRDLSAATSQITDLQKRYDAQSRDLGSLRNELQTKGSLLDEKERTITALTVGLDQRKLSDATTTDQLSAARRDNENLQRDLSASTAQIADLQKRYDEQSRDLVSVRTELHTKVSLLDEKDHTITSLTTEVSQWKREDGVKSEQIEAARRDVEQVRRDLSAASSRAADLQKRFEAQSKELNSVRDELHQIELLEGGGPGQGELSKHAVAQQIARALEKKNKLMEELRRDLAAATSRNAELQKQYEAVSGDFSAIRDELKVKTSQYEGSVSSLSAQVDQWKRADSKKAEQLATLLEQVQKLQQDSSTSTTRLAELQSRYEAQSRDLNVLRTELEAKTSANEGKDRTIASLTAEVDQWKRRDATKTAEIATMNKTIETLQQNLSTSASQLADLKGRYDAQSRDLDSLRDELKAKTVSHDGKDRTIASLTAEVDQWKHADTAKAVQIATTLEQVEKLQREISASTSQVAQLQVHYDTQSRDLVSVRHELQTKTLLLDDRDRTITTLTADVDQWKREDATKAERIATTVKQVETLQRNLSTSTSQITELQSRYEAQSSELASVRRELETKTLLLQEGKDRAVAALTTQVEEWKRADALKAEQIVTTRKQLETLQLQLTNSTSHLTELQQRYEAQSKEHRSLREEFEATSSANAGTITALTSQVEEWKRSDTAKAGELATASKDLEQLRQDLMVSSSQILEYQTQSRELSSQVERWKGSDAAQAGELADTRKELDQLQRDLRVASHRIIELERNSQSPPPAPSLQIEERSSTVSSESKEFYEKITAQYEVRDHAAIVKLTATVDEWLRSDAKRAEEIALELEKRSKENEELRQKLITLKEIYVRSPELKQIFQSQTIQIAQRFEEESRQLRLTLAERQSQLNGVQPFITTADTYADTAIIQMLQKLNAEVQQSTTFMAEAMVENLRPRSTTTKLTKEQTSAMQRASQSLGQTLLDCLVKKDAEEVALYLQIAFQAYLSYRLRWIISSWTTENGRNELINEIYQRLHNSEAQAIAGRWRSLTRTYIAPTCMSDSDALISSTIAGLSEIVVVAGCATSLSDAKTKLSSKFKSNIASIISIAGRFGKMIGEVVSSDFEAFAIRSGETFEEDTMEEDMDDEDKGQARPAGAAIGEKVLCSTHLGMTKRMQLESGKETLTVVKGKVILESFLVN